MTPEIKEKLEALANGHALYVEAGFSWPRDSFMAGASAGYAEGVLDAQTKGYAEAIELARRAVMAERERLRPLIMNALNQGQEVSEILHALNPPAEGGGK